MDNMVTIQASVFQLDSAEL